MEGMAKKSYSYPVHLRHEYFESNQKLDQDPNSVGSAPYIDEISK